MRDYLRPQTLFNAEKFAAYVGELGSKQPKTESITDSWDRKIKEREQKLNETKSNN